MTNNFERSPRDRYAHAVGFGTARPCPTLFHNSLRSGLASVFLGLSFVSRALAGPQIELPRISETVEVTIINVDVVVTDRQGKRVQGLQAADFELFENNRPQTITNFSEIDLSPAQPSEPSLPVPAESKSGEQPQRKFVFFIDNLTIHPFHRRRVLQEAQDFLHKSLGAGDEAMVVSWNRRLKVQVPPTNDVSRVEAGLKVVMRDASLGPGSGYERDQFLREMGRDRGQAVTRARMQAQLITNDLQQSVKAVNTLLTRLAGVGGKKILVLVSEGFPMQPGREFFDAISEGGGVEEAGALREAQQFNSEQLIESIARTANASGVTIYAIHPGGTGSAISAADSSPGSMRSRELSITNSVESLSYVSEMTGGLVTSRTNNFSGAFANIAADLSAYYSLGYRSTTDRKDRERTLQVRTRNRGYSVRARSSFVERSRESEVRDQVVANLFFPTTGNSMRIAARAGAMRRLKRGEVSVPVEIAVPLESLTILPSGEEYVAGFTVFLAAADGKDTVSALVEKNHRIRFAKADVTKTKGAHYTYVLDVQTGRGNRISIAVVDELSKVTGFALLRVPDKP